MTPRPWRSLLAASLLVPLLSCRAGDRDRASPDEDGAGAEPSTTPTPTGRCFAGVPPWARPEEHLLRTSEGTETTALAFPAADGRTVLVLLHQTGPLGACGWGRFAAAAQRRGVTSLAVDRCGHGPSTCPEDSDPVRAIEAAVTFARHELDAERVVLVGASMGGHDAVRAVAAGVDVDAWVDVSGPDQWTDGRLTDLRWPGGPPPPGLVMYGSDEPPAELSAARRLAERTGATYVRFDAGHGYELLTDHRARLLGGGRRLFAFAVR